MKQQQYLNEVKATSIRQGSEFTLSSDIGKFKKGEKVKIDKVSSFGDDIEIYVSNDSGTTDVFYIDKNDDFEELI